jgi:hypothetical protein
MELAITVDDSRAADGVVSLRPDLPPPGHQPTRAVRGSRIVRVVGDAAPQQLLVLNGVGTVLAAGPDLATRRTALVQSLRHLADSAAQAAVNALAATEVFVDARRNRLVSLATGVGTAVISVMSSAPGEYGVIVAGRRAVVQKLPDETLDAAGIRNRLLQRILGLFPAGGISPFPFAETGIVFVDPGGASIAVDVGEWQGRVEYGFDLAAGPIAAGDPDLLDVTPGDRVSVTAEGGVGVSGAVVEALGPNAIGAGAPLPPPDPVNGPDFYILAVPYEEASRLLWEAEEAAVAAGTPGLDGCFRQFLDFERATGRRDEHDDPVELERDARGRPVPARWPLRDLSGIQYYFDKQVRVGQGHTYFRDAAWGLSSISQLTYWRRRMSHRDAFIGQVSVDLGNWYTTSVRDGELVLPAWRSTRQQIAEEVWEQIRDGLDDLIARKAVLPDYYHLDDAIEFCDPAALGACYGTPMRVSIAAAQNQTSLEVNGVQVPVASAAPVTLADLELAIANVTGNAVAVYGQSVVVAPVASGLSSIDLLVLGARNNVEYRIVIGGARASHLSATAVARDLCRDLVDFVNGTYPGAVAVEAERSLDPNGPPVPVVRIQLAAGLSVSALACEMVNGRPVPLLVADPAGELRLAVAPELRIEDADQCTPARNATPFLINGAEELEVAGIRAPTWGWRPGLHVSPGDPANLPPPAQLDDTPIFYRLSCRRWLMVGNQMATWTRLSTMESANESARHAVRALLHAVMTAVPGPNAPPGAGTLLGDFPDVWNLEEHEFDDAEPLKRLDEQLVADGLPHFLDILGVDQWIDGLPDQILGPQQVAHLKDLVEQSIEQVKSDWGFADVDEIVTTIQDALKGLLGA